MSSPYEFLPVWAQPEFGSAWPNIPSISEWRRYHFYVGQLEVCLVLILAYLFTVARRLFQKQVGAEAREMLLAVEGTKKKSKKTPISLATVKYAESCWKLVYYSVSVTCASLILILNDWFDESYSTAMWTHMADEASGIRTMSLGAWLYQLVCLSFYVHSLYAHVFIEVKRSDFVPMLIHHIVTIFLIGGSFSIGFYRIGIAILWLHDISDVILESAKLSVYRGEETLGNILFALFVGSWIIFRLLLFPLYIMKSTFYGSAMTLGLVPFHTAFNVLLAILLVLHFIWFAMITAVLVKIIRGSELEDTREKED